MITGTVDTYQNSVRVFSLQFTTKQGATSPVYGSQGSGSFSYECPDGYQIVGILGRSGAAVDALGVYIDVIPG